MSLDPGIITNQKEIEKYILNADWNNNFHNWVYDLRLGNEVYLSSDKLPIHLKEGDTFFIRSGDFALFITEEEIELPENVMAFISIRFGHKRKGLINVSGFHVDPLFKGKLIFSVFNAGPNDIVLRRKEAVFMIFFQRMNPIVSTVTESDIKEGYDCIPTHMINDIKGKSVTLSKNAASIEKLEFYFKVLFGMVLALFSVVIGVLLKQ